MKKLSQSILEFTEEMTTEQKSRGKISRAIQVKDLWKDVVIRIYGTGAKFILSSTNAVYILTDHDLKELIVYSSDSLVRDSLNNMREFILHEFAVRGEEIGRFRILASRLGMRDRHPFQSDFFPELEQLDDEEYKRKVQSTRLTEYQRKMIEETSCSIDDIEIRESFKKAMTACIKSQNS